MLLSLIKVRGHSMEPFLEDGSFFISSSIPYFVVEPKIGDVIVFKFENKEIVKKIMKIESEKYLIEGLNKSDSKFFPPIKRKEILGKLIIKL